MGKNKGWVGVRALCVLAVWAFAACNPSRDTNQANDQTIFPLGFGGKSVILVAVDQTNSLNLYVVVKREGLYRSQDGSSSWQLLDRFTGSFVYDANQLLIDPLNPATLYWIKQGTVLKSTDRGTSWSNIGPSMNGGCLAVDPQIPGVLFLNVGSGIYKSVDGGDSWRRLFNINFDKYWGSYVVSFAIDRKKSGLLYAQYQEFWGDPYIQYREGIIKSVDGGDTWQEVFFKHTDMLSQFFISNLVLHPDDSTILYAGGNPEIIKSTDGGCTWIPLDGSPRASSLAISRLRGGSLDLGREVTSAIDSYL